MQEETFWNNPNDDPKVVDRERINNRFRAKGKFGLSDLKRYLYNDICIRMFMSCQSQSFNMSLLSKYSYVGRRKNAVSNIWCR